MIIERDLPVKMDDGVVLRADVYRPDTKKKVPIVIECPTPHISQGSSGNELGENPQAIPGALGPQGAHNRPQARP